MKKFRFVLEVTYIYLLEFSCLTAVTVGSSQVTDRPTSPSMRRPTSPGIISLERDIDREIHKWRERETGMLAQYQVSPVFLFHTHTLSLYRHLQVLRLFDLLRVSYCSWERCLTCLLYLSQPHNHKHTHFLSLSSPEIIEAPWLA